MFARLLMLYLKFQLNNETKSELDLNVINVEVSENLLMAGNNPNEAFYGH